MSVDPDPTPASGPTPPKNPAEPAGESADLVRLKRRFKKGANDPEEGENSDQTIQLLSTLLQDLISKKEQSGAPEPEATKTAKFHRLSKTGGGSASPSPQETTAPPLAADGGTEQPPAPSTAPATGGAAAAPASFRHARAYDPPEWRKRLRWWKTLCLLGILSSAAATYFAVTHFRPATGETNAPAKPLSAASDLWSDAALQQLDQALSADQAGDTKGALRIASALQKPGETPLPGLELYLAGLHTRLERTYDAEADLLRLSATSSPAETALIDAGLAFNFSRTRDFEKASDHYRDASRLDPFSAALFYRWGEAARHLGHFADAMASFRRASDRVPTGQPENESLRECIGLKMRLCGIEEGQEEKLQADLAERLKAPNPSGYWLLTAAASALQRKSLPEAAGFLGRARDAMGKEQFDALLNDYFFRAYADRKELADFFPTEPAARRAKLLPTMTYTIEP